MTCLGRITTRRKLRLFLNSLFSRHVFVNNAENAVTNPTEMSHGVAIQEMFKPRSLTGSCMLIGTMAEAIIRVPMHIWQRKIGCDAFTTSFSRLIYVHNIHHIDITMTSPPNERQKARIGIGIRFISMIAGGSGGGGMVELLAK